MGTAFGDLRDMCERKRLVAWKFLTEREYGVFEILGLVSKHKVGSD